VNTRIPTTLASCALAVAIGLGGAMLSRPAAAAPALGPVLGMTSGLAAPVEDVRWVNRCRPQTVHRRDRAGRPVRVTREVCRRVWVGPPRRGY
jgi:hypothetical protein